MKALLCGPSNRERRAQRAFKNAFVDEDLFFGCVSHVIGGIAGKLGPGGIVLARIKANRE